MSQLRFIVTGAAFSIPLQIVQLENTMMLFVYSPASQPNFNVLEAIQSHLMIYPNFFRKYVPGVTGWCCRKRLRFQRQYASKVRLRTSGQQVQDDADVQQIERHTEWERGQKHRNGIALKLLSLVDGKGLQALA
jgi:hypothetical protein